MLQLARSRHALRNSNLRKYLARHNMATEALSGTYLKPRGRGTSIVTLGTFTSFRGVWEGRHEELPVHFSSLPHTSLTRTKILNSLHLNTNIYTNSGSSSLAIHSGLNQLSHLLTPAEAHHHSSPVLGDRDVILLRMQPCAHEALARSQSLSTPAAPSRSTMPKICTFRKINKLRKKKKKKDLTLLTGLLRSWLQGEVQIPPPQ